MAVNIKRRNGERKKTRSVAKSWTDNSTITGWGNEALALVVFAVTIVFGTSVLTQQLLVSLAPSSSLLPYITSVADTLGPLGKSLGMHATELMGWSALVPAFWLAWVSWYCWTLDSKEVKFSFKANLSSIIGLFLLLFFSSALGSIIFGSSFGGTVGRLFSEPIIRAIGKSGAIIINASLVVAALSLSTRQSIGTVLAHIGTYLKNTIAYLFIIGPIYVVRYLYAAIVTFFQLSFLGWRIATKGWNHAFSGPIREQALPKPRKRGGQTDEAQDESYVEGSVDQSSAGFGKFDLGLSKKKSKATDKELKAAPLLDEESQADLSSDIPEEEEEYSHVVVMRRRSMPQVEDPKKQKKKIEIDHQPQADFSAFKRPSFDLLTKGEVGVHGEDDDELLQKSRQIENKLRDFNILGRVTEVHPGPVITLFEFEPAPGVKVGKIAALQDDLAMSLRATSIRIIAPIPKKGTVGIEVPNKNRDMVRLRDVLDHPEFSATESILTIPLGKDTYGDPVYVDIATMPHLLMAGATGTGKSVCINALLVSLLYKASPADLGLILIDPKVLELSVYEGIPHLKVPVVTLPKQAKAVLDWAVKEMDRRYRMMQKYGVRNIDGYNRIVSGKKEEEDAHRKSQSIPELIELSESEILENGTIIPEEAPSIDVDKAFIVEELKPLPKIVIVIDELADLMLTVGRDIEELITRLAQKARAAGIHLIVATQRPSVDVITGLIKANFPARLSFRVTSRIDSRTILDSMGSERLLGKGDMLFMQPGGTHLRRIHGAFISDSEVQRVVEAVKSSASPCYDQKILDLCEQALKEEADGPSSGEAFAADEFDPLYDKAVELIVQKGQASTSMIQRVFRIGYNRAARIIEMMEREGVIGPMDGVKPREVLVQTPEE